MMEEGKEFVEINTCFNICKLDDISARRIPNK